MPSKLELAGQTFGPWTVLGEAPRRTRHPYWLCRCICGKEKELQGSVVSHLTDPTCYCNRPPNIGPPVVRHGMHGHPAYRSWQGMHQRCGNPKDRAYVHYGARGIKVCKRWASFMPFWKDMGPSWFEGATVERKENRKGYSPQNCKWAPKAEQSKNRRTVAVIDGTPWGDGLTLPDIGRKIDVSPCQMAVRYRKGWRGENLWSPPAEKGARITPRVHGSKSV